MYANDYKEAGALKKLADKYGICILLIHHLRKQSAADPFDQISGSTAYGCGRYKLGHAA